MSRHAQSRRVIHEALALLMEIRCASHVGRASMQNLHFRDRIEGIYFPKMGADGTIKTSGQ